MGIMHVENGSKVHGDNSKVRERLIVYIVSCTYGEIGWITLETEFGI